MTNKRSAKGNGSVRQRENGAWEARCTINGKRMSFYGEKQSEVLRAMRAAQKASDDGVYFEPAKVTLSKWLDMWLVEYVKPSCRMNLILYSQIAWDVSPFRRPRLNASKRWRRK